MNHPKISNDTPAWIFQVWAAFILSVVAVGAGIYMLPVEPWIRGYMGMAFAFLMASCFTLSKTVRDTHESSKLINRVNEAKAEKVLNEFEGNAV